jgi:formyl-CoA transferase
MPDGSLHGLRIIDTSEGVAGGYCTRFLAGLGADVIKLERPGVGDSLRRAGPFPGDVVHAETSVMHLHLNAAKRSVTLALASASGLRLFARLLETADACVTDDPAVAEHAGRIQTHLVISTITPFGASGPRAGNPGTDLVTMAAGGYLSLNGDPDREPVRPYGDQSEHQAGLHAALGTLAALRAREGGAPGQLVDVSMQEASGFLTAGALQRHALMRRTQTRAGARPAGFAPNRLYPSTVRPCVDGHVHVHCHNRFHDLISVLMDEPRLAEPDVLAEPLGHADEIDALMDRWLATRSRREAVAEAQDLRVPMAEVFNPGEVMDDELGHLRERGFFVDVAHPVAGAVRQPGAPVVMPASPWRIRRAPLLGEHTVDVLCGDLALSRCDLTRLSAAGVV